jgi:hypothetical protein
MDGSMFNDLWKALGLVAAVIAATALGIGFLIGKVLG